MASCKAAGVFIATVVVVTTAVVITAGVATQLLDS